MEGVEVEVEVELTFYSDDPPVGMIVGIVIGVTAASALIAAGVYAFLHPCRSGFETV